MKFCKDCQHIRVPANGIEYARCDFEAPIDLVSGDIARPYCSTARAEMSGHCKIAAVHFALRVDEVAA